MPNATDHTMSTTKAPADSALASLDAWSAANPWHPRIAPFIAFIAMLFVIDLARGWSLYTYPLLYFVQGAVVAWLLWRYRRLLPEMTVRFHWLAIPTGLGLCWAWVALGSLMVQWRPDWFDYLAGQPHYFEKMLAASPVLYWVSLILRLIGMSLLVPLFEEVFTRSAMLRGLHDGRKTMIGLLQLAQDIPLAGEWIGETEVGRKAAAAPPMFTKQLLDTPLGRLSVFGVAASTVIFMLNHAPRDWAGCIACGLVWCAMLGWTNRSTLSPEKRLGLGPIIWSHGITNAALWAYCLSSGDWQWM